MTDTQTITDEEGKVFHIVPELTTFLHNETAQAARGAVYDAHGYPAGCSACHFNKKERKQPKHPIRSRFEHCNLPDEGDVSKHACAEHKVIFVTPRNLKKYPVRAVAARMTGELK
jgi:hypothetical protein